MADVERSDHRLDHVSLAATQRWQRGPQGLIVHQGRLHALVAEQMLQTEKVDAHGRRLAVSASNQELLVRFDYFLVTRIAHQGRHAGVGTREEMVVDLAHARAVEIAAAEVLAWL